MADLRRIWELWNTGQIDGLYTLTDLAAFQADLDHFAALRGVGRIGSP